MKTSKKYTRELYRQFKYLAAWLPGTPFALGDIGILKGREFTKIGNLKDEKFKIDFDIEKDTTPADINHSSKGAVTISIKAAGSASPSGSTLTQADAGVTVEFSKENAILFKAKGTLNNTIKNQIKLGDQILELYKEGKWDKDYVVITELVEAKSSTIMISSEKTGKIELKANGQAGNNAIDIADASLGFSTTFSKGLSTEIIAESGLTPLFKASKVKSRFLKPAIFEFNKLFSDKMLEKDFTALDNNLNYFGEVTFEDVSYEEIEV